MTKIVLIILATFAIASCSWIDEKTREEIKMRETEAINNIVEAADRAVIDAENRINNEISNFVNKDNDNIEALMKASLNQIENTTNINRMIALISFIISVLSLAIGVVIIGRYRNVKFLERVIASVHGSRRVKGLINEVIDEKRISAKSSGMRTEDVRSEIQRIVMDPRVLDMLSKEISNRLGQTSSLPVVQERPASAKAGPSQHSYVELFARDSQTKTLPVFSSHQKGKTIYKLILENSDSTTAVLDICTERDDVVGRILRLNNEDLDAVCLVSRNSDKPENVVVRKKGKAQKDTNSEWVVVDKIEVEIN